MILSRQQHDGARLNRDDDINNVRDEQARARRVQNLQDFIAESAGLNTGKRLRFHSEAETPRGRDARQQERERSQNLTFAAQQRFQQLRMRLDELDRASTEALRKAERDLREVQDRAAVDDQGRRMYRTQDGRTAFYEDHTEVPREIQDRTDFRNKPFWETFQTRETDLQEALEYHKQVQEAQQLADSEQLSPDEMAAVLGDLEDAASDNVLAALSNQPRVGTSAAREHSPDANSATSRDSFNRAVAAEPATQNVRNDRVPPSQPEILKP